MTAELAVELRELAGIRPYEQNPRLNDNAVEAVAASLAEFGFRQPIVIDSDGVIIAGHTRYKAAKKLGLMRVPVHVAIDLTPEQVRAYRIADNQTGGIADWNYEILPIEIASLRDSGFDLSSLGFSEKTLVQLLESSVAHGMVDPDAIPEPPDEPVTQPGDLYILGDHRLLCGDSANPEHVDQLLDGNVIHLCHTDPPYNVKVEPRSNNAILAGVSSFGLSDDAKAGLKIGLVQKARAKDRPLINDSVSDEEFGRLLDGWFGNIARALLPGHAFYIWGGYANLASYPAIFRKHGLYFSQAIVWDKQHPVLTRKDFMGAWEMAFYGWSEGAGHRFFGPNNATDLWHVKKVPSQKMVHLTEKPVELAVSAIRYSSKPGENVLELFGGSGSTLIACEQTGRRCFAMELDQLYCDVIVRRWEEFTGEKAGRIGGHAGD